MRPSSRVRPSACFGLALVLFALGSCASPGEPTPTAMAKSPDVIRDRVVAIDTTPSGSAYLTFALSQRRATIDPQHSPEPAAMLARAREALANGREVAVTIDASTSRQKGDDGPPFWVLALVWSDSDR